jgi:hypothetical protein
LSLALTGAAAAIDDDRASPDALRILIVDDHPAVRRALREMLHQRPQLSVVGDASNGSRPSPSAHTLRPDVILMDVSMPHMDGVEATARIRTEAPDIRILGCRCWRGMRPRTRSSMRGGRLLCQGDRHATVDRSPADLSRTPRRGDRTFVVPTRPRVCSSTIIRRREGARRALSPRATWLASSPTAARSPPPHGFSRLVIVMD